MREQEAAILVMATGVGKQLALLVQCCRQFDGDLSAMPGAPALRQVAADTRVLAAGLPRLADLLVARADEIDAQDSVGGRRPDTSRAPQPPQVERGTP